MDAVRALDRNRTTTTGPERTTPPMNEFTIVDTDGRTHWLSTCYTCRALLETDHLSTHIEHCARVTVMTSPAFTGVPMGHTAMTNDHHATP